MTKRLQAAREKLLAFRVDDPLAVPIAQSHCIGHENGIIVSGYGIKGERAMHETQPKLV